MLGVKVGLKAFPKSVKRATNKGAYRSLRHAAFSIRKSAIESMVFAKGPSKPGTPPHAHTERLRRSVVVESASDKNKYDIVVGPSYSRVKIGGRPPWLARVLEHGGTFKRKKKRKRRGRPRKDEEPQQMVSVTYPARPFMQPALQRNLARFHKEWQGAIS